MEFLTNEEKKIWVMLSKGYTYEEISAKLGLPVHSVQKIMDDVIKELGAKNEPNALYLALTRKLISLTDFKSLDV